MMLLTTRHDKQHKYVLKELTKLKSTVNNLEQQKLEKNIIIKGVPETEGDDHVLLSYMVDSILSHIDPEFHSEYVVNVRRVGAKKENAHRPILVVMSNTDRKLAVIKNIKGKELNCAKFSNKGKLWGTNEQKIFIGDHLTSTNNNIFYHARQLRKKNKVKYAWTKLGQVYIKENEDSRAINVTSIEQLSSFANQLESSDEQSDGETETEQKETETEYDTDAAPKRKHQTSKRSSKHLSPKNTRSKKNKTDERLKSKP